MFKMFNNFSFRKKIVSGFTFTHVLLGAVIIMTLVILQSAMKKYDVAYSEKAKPAAQTADASGVYSRIMESLERGILMGETQNNAAALADVAANLSELGVLLDAVEEAAAAEPETAAMFEELHAAYHDTNDELTQIYALAFGVGKDGVNYANANVKAARDIYCSESFTTKVKAVETAFDKMFDMLVASGDDRMTRTNANLKSTGILMVALFFVALLLSVFVVAASISKSLRVPIKHLVDATEKMATGDVDVEIKRYYNDEVGELTDAIVKMVGDIKSQANIAGELANGNYCVEVESRGEHDLMNNSIMHMVEEENRVMTGIRQAVTEIRTGSQEVASASQSLAQGSTEQASAIQEITASINDITERTKVNASDAQTANNLVVNAKDDATEGNQKMKEMIEAMADINQSSENISKIIKVIDDIAFQTNILALNAAVEAARAGQHGRGFAVVADEVRNLAGKSAQAASETAELIEDSIAKVNKGSKLAEETAAALEGIVQVIDKIVTITNSIAVASNDQATAISQIDQAIGQVSQVVQTNSATSEQCAAASEELSAQAGKLRDMISRYKLKNQGAVAVTPSVNEPVGLPDDEYKDAPPVISLDDGFGKY